MRKLLAVFVMATILGCGASDPGPLADKSAVFLQRQPRLGGIGDVFQYTSYIPGGKLSKLTPATADGVLSELCCSQFAGFEQVDIQAYDIAFDAKSIVFSGKLNGSEPYGLFVLTLDDNGNAAGAPTQLLSDPNRDAVYPIFAPGDRVIYMTNEVVEPGTPQHRDEYERGTTTQLASISLDGTNVVLGPRNLSHRVSPSMLSDGRVLFTQWDHLQDVNAGHLMMVNPDFTNLREVFGKEGSGITNSYLKAVEIEPGRLVSVATDRDRTLQSGKLIDIRMGLIDDQGTYRQSEANSSVRDMTPLVPGGRDPSQNTVGRYYDAYPVKAAGQANFGDSPKFLVSWADGPVEQEVLATAGLHADFGLYLFDSSKDSRLPIFNDPDMWDVMARPLTPRSAPPMIAPGAPNDYSADSFYIGSLDVHDSSISNDLIRGDVVRVRIIEGFSAEEGIPDDFGLTEADGAALLGEALVHADGSWSALVPANVPIHLQAIDKFGMAIVNEPVWFSGRPGESRFCGGCHEDRASTSIINPGITDAVALGPDLFDVPRASRVSTNYARSQVVGVPWDLALQPMFDAKCISCHEGTPGPANRSITITDTVTNETMTIVFDLRGIEVAYGVGTAMMSGYTASHLSLMGPDMMELQRENPNLVVTGDLPIFIDAGNARGSMLFQKLNSPQMYPFNTNVRVAGNAPVHAMVTGGVDLTEDEYYLLLLMADSGGQFFSRENAPGTNY